MIDWHIIRIHKKCIAERGVEGLKENNAERMPRCDSFNLFDCGSIAACNMQWE